jgi:FkbM family methyltransferase
VIPTLRRRLAQARKLMKLLPTRGFRRGLRQGVAASVEHHALLKGIPLATLVDVGANIGQFSLLARTLHPAVRIHAFEPLSRPAEKYHHLFGEDSQTTLYRCAIGPQSSVSQMYVSGRDDSSSLLPITDEQVRFAAGTAMVGTEQVTVKRLDDVLGVADIISPAMLKLDVQGFELSALQGCGRLLDAMDFVYVEVSFVTLYSGQALADEIVQFLFTRGFSLAGVNNPAFDDDGRCIQADLLFRQRTGTNLADTTACALKPQ